MTEAIRLGGFKVLKGVARFSLIIPEKSGITPALLLRSIAERKINLPYLTCFHRNGHWGLNLLVETGKGLQASLIIEEVIGKPCEHTSECVVFSIFPHKKDPLILCNLIDAFKENSVKPEALAISPSAISVVLQEKDLNRASSSLFGPFSFSAYRTPEDWKLAQEGKEEIYKEVIATYQESRPKVYGLEYYEEQEIEHIDFQTKSISATECFVKIGPNERVLTFTASYPAPDHQEEILGLCISGISGSDNPENIVFSMNGPHFGDRYGICFEMMESLENRGVYLLGLSCTIASITGVVNIKKLEETIEGIKECFDVPMVVKK
jgi:hypothetical protein